MGLARRQRCRLVAVYVRTLPSSVLAVADTAGHAAATVADAQDEVERQLRAALAGLGVDACLVVRRALTALPWSHVHRCRLDEAPVPPLTAAGLTGTH
ncbi:hypothetical protein KZZ52_45925 [Dactylosporangium sp. AC04546]|uniref:hypothetical protein n=1 Tax=Dactylosporangium sp. AC04546 TaxID=2862460 RepID=UPI001EDDF37C|nr:hypothetical protein [Dactylosporangium sp. AC04546]WVK81256.1 hypothetical protein KZZ52_45925 [Dactylosporangium sp. AC04546]